ncbi:hypothetical protein L195_g045266 [Trifolium pratense]|uniref:Uncharacterized protein n=1 Tax=Trifolium pratense TaxID=57577 RepID=A0A2K3MEG6_TRIPR|nr:hypothetical protein L195_g045266 [Trifolium pratense]
MEPTKLICKSSCISTPTNRYPSPPCMKLITTIILRPISPEELSSSDTSDQLSHLWEGYLQKVLLLQKREAGGEGDSLVNLGVGCMLKCFLRLRKVC